MTYFMQIITAFLGSLGFSVIFNIKGTKLFLAASGGILSWGMYLLLAELLYNPVSQTFIAAMLVTFYAEVCARLMRTPTTTFLTASLIPLVPGSGLYYTMSYGVNGMFSNFITSGVHTLALAVALAGGIVVASSVYRIFMVVLQQLRK
jgi:uncharacterized membrane protein YjjB (DUF3815 family)